MKILIFSSSHFLSSPPLYQSKGGLDEEKTKVREIQWLVSESNFVRGPYGYTKISVGSFSCLDLLFPDQK